jgi:two-component system, OmpR family, response regulator BaeR
MAGAGKTPMANVETPPVLIAEDDPKIADLLANYLQSQGWRTVVVGNGEDALMRVHRFEPAVVLLDVMLPGLCGLDVCRQLRLFSAVPVIMLTARVDEVDKVLGLGAGADDYVCKPFSPREVAARVQAQWRRSQGLLTMGMVAGFKVHKHAQRISWNDQWIDLTSAEYRLFSLLLARPGAVLSRAQLLDCLHADFRDVSDRTIDSHVRNLRRKIELVRPEGSGIAAVYGAGYRFSG